MDSISVTELKDRLAAKGSFALVDVRSEEEFAAGHIPGAQNVPLSTLHQAVEELKSYNTLYVCCRSGGRSSVACRMLGNAGVHAVNVEGGTLAWEDAGFAIDR